uniref:protein-tyrosine-phosphatase n=1 Tax=Cacopsylla melanoneura TaxID=428564 RepID=A0A8D8PTC7_9HEMI
MQNYEERIPLRTILQHFVNHVESLELASQSQQKDCYEEEFLDLKLFSESIKTNADFSSSEGEKEVNKKKNRYKDILPFDVSRVILDEYAGIPGSDYINANFIKGASGSMAYIASQGPLPHTVNDFWRMIVQCQVKVIVMACNEKESGKHKCENYWVEEEGVDKQFGMANVRLIKASTICPDFCVRMLKLTYTNSQNKVEERTVCQFHYSAWPDHGVPPLVRPLLDMVRLVRDTQASETLPVLVHCSAGCGRTGTICAIDYVWGLLRAGKLNRDFSLFTLVREMRKQRIAMVQTKEQYILVHQAVKELFLEQLRMIDSHPYENIDSDGCLISSEAPPEPLYDTIESCRRKDPPPRQDQPSNHNKDMETPQKKPLKNNASISSTSQTPQKNFYSQPTTPQNTPSNTPLQTPTKPRIAKLKSLFEKNLTYSHLKCASKNKPSVCRSNSLGAVHVQHKTNMKNSGTPTTPANTDQQKHKIVTIVKPVQKNTSTPPPPPSQTCNVKRSKSLRLLSSSSKLSFNVEQPEPLSVRTLSLESIVDEPSNDRLKQAKSSSHIEKIHTSSSASPYDFEILHKFKYLVSGLGIRERRNSFRKAVEKSSQQNHLVDSHPGKYTPKPFHSNQISSPVAVVKPQRHIKMNSNDDHNDSNNNTSGNNFPQTPSHSTIKSVNYETDPRYASVDHSYKPNNPSQSQRDLQTQSQQSRDSVNLSQSQQSRDSVMVTPKRNVRESNYSSPKTVSGVKMRNRARDDLALCNGNQSSKVKRHASVMLYRNSLIEDSTTHKPLTVWQGSMTSPETSWSQTPGVDIDQVAASMSLQSDSTKKHLNTVLQNIQTRKSKSMDPVYAEANALSSNSRNVNNLGIGNINLGSSGSSSSSLGNNSSPDSSNRMKMISNIVNSPISSLANSNNRMNKKYVSYNNSNTSSSGSLKQNNNPTPSVKQQYL